MVFALYLASKVFRSLLSRLHGLDLRLYMGKSSELSLLLRFARHEIFNLLLQSYRSIPIVSLWITPSLWLGRITCFRFSSWQHQYRVLWPFFKDWFSFTLFHVSYSFLFLFLAFLT